MKCYHSHSGDKYKYFFFQNTNFCSKVGQQHERGVLKPKFVRVRGTQIQTCYLVLHNRLNRTKIKLLKKNFLDFHSKPCYLSDKLTRKHHKHNAEASSVTQQSAGICGHTHQSSHTSLHHNKIQMREVIKNNNNPPLWYQGERAKPFCARL